VSVSCVPCGVWSVCGLCSPWLPVYGDRHARRNSGSLLRFPDVMVHVSRVETGTVPRGESVPVSGLWLLSPLC